MTRARSFGAAIVAGVFAAALALAASAPARAEADGPDFYRVVGLRPGESLSLRDAPSAQGRTIAHVPAGARVRNLGRTRGGLSFAEWERASQARRAAARRTTWRLVEHRRVAGWARAIHLAE
ncbi:hypothetical protein [Methylocella sp.]|uniref:hypothetical protein n=1 Tax=Methylocella sp. TaxID=1978226 RepID=UPI0037847ED0